MVKYAYIAGSSNGRIVDSESIHLGSNPSPAAREKLMSYFVYILRTSSNTLYIGQTNNLKKRIKQHQSKSAKSAKYMRYFTGFDLVYKEKYMTRTEAMKRESELKKWTKAQKEALINS